ncbi:galactokinase [Tenacibaculum agarivorans]|uniref:galactokinase n=1 Tax=Tenacibaculum agarivorans TaxID=1908389 RepID=UPI00094B822F|nr:galactokinase [Tenacibaculum agarivorans]
MNKNDSYDLVVKSPGRINLIGEHVDYNGGHVLPGAIDKKITLKFKKNNTNSATVYSKNIDSQFTIDLSNLNRSTIEWHNYIIGVIYYINILKPKSVKGFDCYIDSNLPLGSGVSSSAALECGIAKGLNELFIIGLTDIEIINLSKDAEHTMVGTKCGIMDQFAVVKGEKNNLLLLNCKTNDYETIKVDFGDYKLVLLNTNVSHNLASSEYNVRRSECETAMETIKAKYNEYEYLCDVEPQIIKEFKNLLPEKIYNRALYVSKENQRTLKAVEAIKRNDLDALGGLLYKSHEGLSNLYEVSCNELDFLVDCSKKYDQILGARMMGGGFGGCTINIIHKDFVDNLIEEISYAYRNEFSIDLTPIAVHIDDGVKI